jgi:hypothetical protein
MELQFVGLAVAGLALAGCIAGGTDESDAIVDDAEACAWRSDDSHSEPTSTTMSSEGECKTCHSTGEYIFAAD